MTDRARSLGGRIKAARKARGVKSMRALVEMLGDPSVTIATLENIESGRRMDPPLSLVLNIAFLLKVPPALLLNSLEDEGKIDLANLHPDLARMSRPEFDSWLSGELNGAYRAASAAEREDLAQLEAFRDLQRLQREIEKERAVQSVDRTNLDRLTYLEAQAGRARELLANAGWNLT